MNTQSEKWIQCLKRVKSGHNLRFLALKGPCFGVHFAVYTVQYTIEIKVPPLTWEPYVCLAWVHSGKQS